MDEQLSPGQIMSLMNLMAMRHWRPRIRGHPRMVELRTWSEASGDEKQSSVTEKENCGHSVWLSNWPRAAGLNLCNGGFSCPVALGRRSCGRDSGREKS